VEASKVLANLRKLQVDDCSELVRLGEREVEENDNSGCNQLTSLKILELWSCKNLERCSCPDSIESLTIYSCDSITCVSFPTGGCQKLKSLKIDYCKQLSEKELEKVLCNTSTLMLEVVQIKSFPADALPTLTSLKRLTISQCGNMDVDSFGLWPPKLGYLRIAHLKKPISKWGPQTFPTSLVDLWLWGNSAEEDDVTS
nr:NB-ARC domains-containing protein [Tanacetum cinerariifolium]